MTVIIVGILTPKTIIIVVDFDTKLNELDMMLENVSSLIAAYRL